MNRFVRLGVWASILAMLLIAAGAVVLRLRTGGLDEGGLRGGLRTLMLFGLPVVIGIQTVFVDRTLASDRPRLSDDHRRMVQGGLLFWSLVCVGICVWLALRDLGGGPPSGDERMNFARILLVLLGVSMAVRGNFFAKVDPPSGEGAPEPGEWTRGVLSAGWILSLMGAVLVVCAIALPMKLLLFAPVVMLPVMFVIGARYRRLMRRQRPAE